jgi:hypothetical protein
VASRDSIGKEKEFAERDMGKRMGIDDSSPSHLDKKNGRRLHFSDEV